MAPKWAGPLVVGLALQAKVAMLVVVEVVVVAVVVVAAEVAEVVEAVASEEERLGPQALRPSLQQGPCQVEGVHQAEQQGSYSCSCMASLADMPPLSNSNLHRRRQRLLEAAAAAPCLHFLVAQVVHPPLRSGERLQGRSTLEPCEEP